MDNNERPREQFTTARIRALCRAGFETATPYITNLASGNLEDVPPVVVRAYEALGKYGVGPHPDIVIDHHEWLQTVMEVTTKYLPDEATFNQWWSDVTFKLENA